MAYFPNFLPTSLHVFFFIIFIKVIVSVHTYENDQHNSYCNDRHTQLFILIKNNVVKIIVC